MHPVRGIAYAKDTFRKLANLKHNVAFHAYRYSLTIKDFQMKKTDTQTTLFHSPCPSEPNGASLK